MGGGGGRGPGMDGREDRVLVVVRAGPGGLLAAEAVASITTDGGGDVAEQFRHAYPAIAVLVPGAAQSRQQVIGEQAVSKLLGLDRFLALVAGRDEKPAPSTQALEDGWLNVHVAVGRSKRDPVARKNRTGMAAVKAKNDGTGVDALDPAGDVAHGHTRGNDVVGVGVVRQQKALVTSANLLDDAVTREVDEDQFRAVGLLGQPARQSAHHVAPASVAVGQQRHAIARKAAHLALGQQARQGTGVPASIAQRRDAAALVILTDAEEQGDGVATVDGHGNLSDLIDDLQDMRLGQGAEGVSIDLG